MSKLRVYWIPQVPCTTFLVDVDSVAEGVKLMDTLADYDAFQFEQNIKPDYCNYGGIAMLEAGEWVNWYDDETNEDDPRQYLIDSGQGAGQ